MDVKESKVLNQKKFNFNKRLTNTRNETPKTYKSKT